MLRSKDAENEEVRSAQGRLLAALGLNLMREGRRQRRARRQVKHEFRFTRDSIVVSAALQSLF